MEKKMGKQGLGQKPPGQMPPDFSSLLGGFCPVPKKIVIQSKETSIFIYTTQDVCCIFLKRKYSWSYTNN
jgi:hypothetical protein